MKFIRAEHIRRLISDLDSSWDKSNFVAAIKEDEFDKGNWNVFLYSREGYKHQLIDLSLFAMALYEITSDIHYTMSEYNKATYGEEMVPAIKLW